MNLKMSSKVAAALAIMIIMLIVVGGKSLFDAQGSLASIKDIQVNFNRAITASQIENELTAAALDMRRYTGDQKEEYKKSFE